MENIFLSDEKKQLSKCLKSYLIGKKYYDTDINKSVEYFKQCIKFVNNIKQKNSDCQSSAYHALNCLDIL